MTVSHYRIAYSTISVFLLVTIATKGAIFLDPAFGNDGRVTIDFADSGSRGSDAHFVIRQPSGRLVVAGAHVFPTPFPKTVGIALAGLTDTGSLDPLFGTHGRIVEITNETFRQIADIKMLPDGKFLRLWTHTTGISNSNFLNRYAENGSLDITFSADISSLGNFARPVAMAIRVDGKINVLVQGADSGSWRLLRLNSNGSRDVSFGSNGVVPLNLSRLGNFYVAGMHTLPDGRIFVGGAANSSGAPSGGNIVWVARLDEFGNFDRRFGQQGVLRRFFETQINVRIFKTLLQPDNKILLVGRAVRNGNDSDFLLMRVTHRGRADVDFGQDGVVINSLGPEGSFEVAAAVTLMSDGRIVVAGSYAQTLESPTSFAVVRYSTTGVVQDHAVTQFGETLRASAIDLVVQPDNKIVVVGATQNPDITANGSLFGIARFVQSP